MRGGAGRRSMVFKVLLWMMVDVQVGKGKMPAPKQSLLLATLDPRLANLPQGFSGKWLEGRLAAGTVWGGAMAGFHNQRPWRL